MKLANPFPIAGVMGWPITHSLSPKLHSYWLNENNVKGAYVPLSVRPEHLATALEALKVLGFVGCNLTIPHKALAINFVDEITPLALRIGAINTIVVQQNGTLRGDNTDAFGFMKNLYENIPDFDCAQGPTIVLGAGGAARAVCAALIDAGAKNIFVLNRTQSRSDKLVADFGSIVSSRSWETREAALKDAHLLVNATSLGMNGQPNLEIDVSLLSANAVVYDLIYSPLMTELMIAAEENGNRVIGGLGMLLHQARPGFSFWFGKEPEVSDKLRSFIKNDLAGTVK